MNRFEAYREELMELIIGHVLVGSLSAQDIRDSALDFLINEDIEITDAVADRVAALVDEALEFHYLKQKGWTEETDTEKLEEAFIELWGRGIIAASNFSCCQTCGHTEMIDWLKQDDCKHMRGYTFFHEQDALSMVERDYLYLAYGSRSQTETDSEVIAREICAVLEKHGLEINWSGSVKTRIHIPKIIWRARRVKDFDYAE